MSERKVLNKYYDPNFNPDKLPKNKRPKDKQDNVRMMLPMTMRCTTCGNYLYIGTKFNMRKETCMNEEYLTIKIYRFYFRCTGCYGEITFKTDPKNHDYIVEHGAKRNYEAWKDAQQAELAIKEMRENEEEGNAMKTLEHKTHDTKREMEILDALDDIKQFNKRKAQITHDQLLDVMMKHYEEDEEEAKENQEAVKEMFRKAKEKELEEKEEQKAKELQKLLDFKKPEPKSTSTGNLFNEPAPKKNGIGAKIVLKAKKVKTAEESLSNGTANMLAQTKKPENKPAAPLNLCSYSDDED